jgi:hypothetical protein
MNYHFSSSQFQRVRELKKLKFQKGAEDQIDLDDLSDADSEASGICFIHDQILARMYLNLIIIAQCILLALITCADIILSRLILKGKNRTRPTEEVTVLPFYEHCFVIIFFLSMILFQCRAPTGTCIRLSGDF